MADVWYPAAGRMPGARAGYDRGKNSLRCCVLHYTVGRDSTNIGLNGYFNFLVRRNGEVVQFAPVDALTWHAGEWNPDGPGIEHEYYEPTDGPQPDNILTREQEQASGALCRWLRDEHGIPGSFYDGPRVSRGQPGFITHRSLIQSQEHFDYITAEQWARMTSGSTPAPVTDEEDEMGRPNRFITATASSPWYYWDGSVENFYYVDKNDSGLLLDLGLVKRQDPQVAVVGQPMIDRLAARKKAGG